MYHYVNPFTRGPIYIFLTTQTPQGVSNEIVEYQNAEINYFVARKNESLPDTYRMNFDRSRFGSINEYIDHIHSDEDYATIVYSWNVRDLLKNWYEFYWPSLNFQDSTIFKIYIDKKLNILHFTNTSTYRLFTNEHKYYLWKEFQTYHQERIDFSIKLCGLQLKQVMQLTQFEKFDVRQIGCFITILKKYWMEVIQKQTLKKESENKLLISIGDQKLSSRKISTLPSSIFPDQSSNVDTSTYSGFLKQSLTDPFVSNQQSTESVFLNKPSIVPSVSDQNLTTNILTLPVQSTSTSSNQPAASISSTLSDLTSMKKQPSSIDLTFQQELNEKQNILSSEKMKQTIQPTFFPEGVAPHADELKRKQQQIDNLTQQLATLNSTKTGAINQCEQLQNQLKDLNEKLKEKTNEKNECFTNAKKALEEFDQLKHDANIILARYNKQQTDNGLLKQELKQNNDKITELNSRISNFEEELTQKNNEIDNLKLQFANNVKDQKVQDAITEWNSRIRILEKENEQMTKKLTDREIDLRSMRNENLELEKIISRLREEIQRFESSKILLVQNIEEYIFGINQLQTKLNACTIEINPLKDKIKKNENEISNVKTELTRARENFEKTKKEYNEENEKFKNREQELITLRIEIITLKTNNAKLTADLKKTDELSTQYSITISELNKKIFELENTRIAEKQELLKLNKKQVQDFTVAKTSMETRNKLILGQLAQENTDLILVNDKLREELAECGRKVNNY